MAFLRKHIYEILGAFSLAMVLYEYFYHHNDVMAIGWLAVGSINMCSYFVVKDIKDAINKK